MVEEKQADTLTGSFDIKIYEQGKFSLDIRKRLFTWKVVALEQASQGSSHSTKTVRFQEASGQHP